MSEIADTVAHELFHRRQDRDKDYDAGGLAQKLCINNYYYVRSEVDYALYRSQLVEMHAW